MPRKRSLARNLAEYIPARLAASIAQCFPAERNQHTANLAARVYAACCPNRMRRAEDNILRCFPDWTPEQARQTAVASMQQLFGLAAVDAVQMDRYIHPDRWWHSVDMSGAAPAVPVLQQGGPAILLTGHMGNWELLGYIMSMLGIKLHALARPLDNPLLNRWLLGIREAWGLRVLTKFGAAPEMQAILERGEHLGFIADQNAGQRGIFVPFFGRLASAYKSIGLLAITQNVPIVVAAAFRTAPGVQYAVQVQEVIEPHQWADKDDPLYWVTARYSWALEQLVRRQPDQYLWIHRRWNTRPPHERKGKPVPASLERRVRSLEWLTEAQQNDVLVRSAREAAEVAAETTSHG